MGTTTGKIYNLASNLEMAAMLPTAVLVNKMVTVVMDSMMCIKWRCHGHPDTANDRGSPCTHWNSFLLKNPSRLLVYTCHPLVRVRSWAFSILQQGRNSLSA